ncbi:hypothetical protein CDEST_15528 [Colletotrichum destructivum]|uniref:Uncharacterized protein n=1 Tax=Colletotrichum destructivum TaxID=34406 RepID=A0AAX4J553_9PEZI|nr:hypothetical protein CDEST_15528 [Colletotrichum destructivum]
MTASLSNEGNVDHDEVIFLWSSPVAKVPSSRAKDLCGPDARRTFPSSPRPKSSVESRRKGPHATKRASISPIPAGMVGKCIELGVVEGPDGNFRAVYGCFDTTGRFRRQLRLGSMALDTQPNATNVTHGQIEYRPCFQGMSSQQVRKEFFRRLPEKLYRPLSCGEI